MTIGTKGGTTVRVMCMLLLMQVGLIGAGCKSATKSAAKDALTDKIGATLAGGLEQIIVSKDNRPSCSMACAVYASAKSSPLLPACWPMPPCWPATNWSSLCRRQAGALAKAARRMDDQVDAAAAPLLAASLAARADSLADDGIDAIVLATGVGPPFAAEPALLPTTWLDAVDPAFKITRIGDAFADPEHLYRSESDFHRFLSRSVGKCRS